VVPKEIKGVGVCYKGPTTVRPSCGGHGGPLGWEQPSRVTRARKGGAIGLGWCVRAMQSCRQEQLPRDGEVDGKFER
jgi:hypothetical protein